MLERRHPRIYQWVKPRSLLLHLAFVVIAGGCLIAGWWQVNRAMQGNALSYLYSIEWPTFAVVAGIGWWQLVHDTPEDIARRQEFHRKMRQASAEVVARTLPRSALAVTVSSEEVDGRVLPGAAARAVTTGDHGAGGAGDETVTLPAASRSTAVVAAAMQARLLEADGATEDTDPLTEYNRYLAYLAVRGKAKTWRNPRGE